MFCQEHVAQLRDDRESFDRAGARVLLIGQGSSRRAARFCRDRAVPFDCLTDPEREAYRAYGLKTGTLRELAPPRLAGRYVKANLRRETRQGPLSGDVRQMPGTFVIDTAGVVRFAHRNRDSADNPPNDVVLRALEDLKGA